MTNEDNLRKKECSHHTLEIELLEYETFDIEYQGHNLVVYRKNNINPERTGRPEIEYRTMDLY